jgi:LDH2 family malate/lactate/ureidoglycolate dehydrogenase
VLTLPADRARALCLAVFDHLGFTPTEAADCADAIMFATLRGLDTHGIISILPGIAGSVKAGRIEPRATILTLRESPVTAAYRGNGAAGPAVAAHAMRAAIARARAHGVGLTTVANANHFGAASAYAAMAPREGMIGIVCCNAGPVVAPYGGAGPLHGTNPIAYAAPAGEAPPLVLDIATSAAAHGQIFKAKRRGQPIPLGWALDAAGKPTTDPNAALEGVLPPFGGHKGYGIGVLVDLLTGALTGTTIGLGVRQGDPDRLQGGQAFFLLAINVEFFTDLATYRAKIDQLYRDAKSIPPAEGFSEVLLPGELEWRAEQERRRAGIPLYPADWEALAGGLERAGIPAEIIAAHAPSEG